MVWHHTYRVQVLSTFKQNILPYTQYDGKASAEPFGLYWDIRPGAMNFASCQIVLLLS